MTESEAISYIENYTWSTTRLGLDRTRQLLHRMGDPQKKLKFIHVTGSNGKGSTCAMLDAILRAAGYRTGLYTSPYLEDFCERIQVGGKKIPGTDLAAITEKVRVIADRMEDHPSQFELVTAIAMEYFAQCHCDIVVLEVGMGGALDSTNVIDAPEVAVLTNIGLEHTEYLGKTVEAITLTKSGIIKSGCHAVCYLNTDKVMDVVRKVCEEKQVPLHIASRASLTPVASSLEGQTFRWLGQLYRLRLLGDYQLGNAAVALETVLCLRERGWNVSNDAVSAGLNEVSWPARMEILSRHPLFLLDGGHNPQCAQALAESLLHLFPDKKIVFLAGVLADKDYPGIVRPLLPMAQEFICLTPVSPRALEAPYLAEYINRFQIPATVAESYEDGISAAMDAAGTDGIIVAFGSLYLAGKMRTVFRGAYRRWVRKHGISARDSLTEEERNEASAKIVRRILDSRIYRGAATVMIYRAVRGEVSLDALLSAPESRGKRFIFPRCEKDHRMEAYEPETAHSWKKGSFGIPEPDPAKSLPVSPSEIDLILCPCTAFDEDGNRMGMGGGYYDRYLPRCSRKTIIAAAAFEAQKMPSVPTDFWDRRMECIFTEENQY